jgi:alpha-ketoglutarate-dependent taurine dioxygenase
MPSAAQQAIPVNSALTYTGKEADDIRALALERGWCLFKVDKDVSTSSLSMQLGEIVPSRRSGRSIDPLAPTDVSDAHPASQSRFFGLGEFPFHTDAAYKERPPHLVLLRCERSGSSDRKTFLVRPDLNSDQKWHRLLVHGLICVDNGRSRFYSSILTRHVATEYLRYDPVCTKPVNKAAQMVFEAMPVHLQLGETIYAVTWQDDFCLLIDNWTVMHARVRATLQIKTVC